jgi:hypothetical protein
MVCAMSPEATPSRHGEHGQAMVELVALLPILAALAVVLWQGVVAGQAVWFAGSAARAAARARALGEDERAAARRVLPDRLEDGLAVRREPGDGGVRVAIRIPAVVGPLGLGSVSARARLQDQTR